jgi:prevent-host-death family protein
MKKLSIREMREALPRLDELVAAEGEILVTRHGRPLARVVPFRRQLKMPSHADLRARMPRLRKRSETLIRLDRDAR